MKTNSLIKIPVAALVVLVSACSAPRMAQQNTAADDVYSSRVEPKSYTARTQSEEYDSNQTYTESNSNYDNDYVEDYSGYEYGLGYANRLNNFYYGTGFRPYYNLNYYGYFGDSYMPWYSPFNSFRLNGIYGFYDPWYDHSFYGFYDPFVPYSYRRLGFGFGFGYRFGYPYYMGGGWSNGGYYGGGWVGSRPTVNPNYNPRPSRGVENRPGVNPNNGIVNGRPGDRNTVNRPGTVAPIGRNADRPNPTATTRPQSQGRPDNSSSRPTRETNAPTRVQQRPTYSPPMNSGGGRSQSGGGSSSGGSSSSGRPTRGN